jgi:hypothetical protein
MDLLAHSHLSQETDSSIAGEEVGRTVREAFAGEKMAVLIVYATINHDQGALLAGVRKGVGPDVLVVGCSAQGVMSLGNVEEGGFVVGAIGLGGDSLAAAAAIQENIGFEGAKKGHALAKSLKTSLAGAPELLVLLYDPLSGIDVNEVLDGIRSEISSPIVGGAAGQNSGPVSGTFQYFGTRAVSQAAVLLGITGRFGTELGVCHGTSPTGVVMTLTRAEGNKLLEIDGRPALDVWRETIGWGEDQAFDQDQTAALAMGIERKFRQNGREEAAYLIRAAFGFDTATKAIVVQAGIPEGSRIMFHHRTVEVVKQGTVDMAKDLVTRLAGRRIWAVLGFECGARTAPFLGEADTLQENLDLQKTVAPHAPWLGLLAWGEIAPCGGEPAFHNYTYPLVVLTH